MRGLYDALHLQLLPGVNGIATNSANSSIRGAPFHMNRLIIISGIRQVDS